MSGIAADSPLAHTLQERLTPKLVELGWSSGEQDDTLAEYIILMLVNGNNEQQIETELSTDLLGGEAEEGAAAQFSKWLFDQVRELQQEHGGPPAPSAPADTGDQGDASMEAVATNDADMAETGDGSGVIPTGPKAMRNGPKSSSRDKRMGGGIGKSSDRGSDSILHRVRGGAGAGRINSHSREPPKGPRQTNIQRNLAGVGNGRGMLPGMPGPMPQMPYGQQNGAGMMMDGGQMQQMLHMLERQAQMMAQMSNNMQPNGNFSGGRGGFGGKRGGFQGRRPDHQQRPPQGTDTEMGEDNQSKNGDAAPEAQQEGRDPSHTMCKFNKMCNNADCPFAHSGPVTFTGLQVDFDSECAHGAACMNNRCASRHPSPAKKAQYQANTPCKYGPYCAKPGCSFQHPPNGPCKNGADCTEENCVYWHNPVMCKYPQCTNKNCPYRHGEGQKRGYYKSKSVVFNGAQPEHVSNRQFVQAEGEEELIKPEPMGSQEGMDVVS